MSNIFSTLFEEELFEQAKDRLEIKYFSGLDEQKSPTFWKSEEEIDTEAEKEVRGLIDRLD